jgi:hypothetical protein
MRNKNEGQLERQTAIQDEQNVLERDAQITPVFSKLVLIRLPRMLIEDRRECEGVCVCGVRGTEGPSRISLLRSI